MPRKGISLPVLKLTNYLFLYRPLNFLALICKMTDLTNRKIGLIFLVADILLWLAVAGNAFGGRAFTAALVCNCSGFHWSTRSDDGVGGTGRIKVAHTG